jgi:hypothetical protein
MKRIGWLFVAVLLAAEGCNGSAGGAGSGAAGAATRSTGTTPTSNATGSTSSTVTSSSTGAPGPTSPPGSGSPPPAGTSGSGGPATWGAGALTGTPGTTYYVSPNGSDTNAGTQTSPFRQIRAAVAVVKPGDTVLVADGSYLGFDVNTINGVAGQPITIQAQASAALVTATTDRPDNRDNIFITFSSYIIIDGLSSSNAPRSGCRIDNSPNITVENCTFGTNATWGTFTDFSNDTLIQNNECFASAAQHGIYVSNSSANPVVRLNRCHDNAGCGIHMNGDLSQGGTGLITGALVEQNTIWNNGTAGGSAINMDGVQSSTVVNNLLYGNHASGISAFQTDGAQGPSNVLIYDNTIDQASDGRACLNISNTAGPLTVRNNICYDEHAGSYAISFGAAADVTNTDSDYNILGGAASITNDGGNTLFTLAQWQSQGHETHSLASTLTALFVSSTAGNYQLATGSPAIGAGEIIATVTSDIDGTPRPAATAYDIGCYEH